MSKKVEVLINGSKKICDISRITYDGDGNVIDVSTKPIIEEKYLLGVSDKTGKKLYGGLWIRAGDAFTILE